MAKCGRSSTRGDGKSLLHRILSVFCCTAARPASLSCTITHQTLKSHMCLYVFSQSSGRQTSAAVDRESFWQLLSEMTARRISLDSWWWIIFALPVFPHHRELLWPPPCPPCEIAWSCCINIAVLPERFPPASPHRARASWEPGGGGRTLPLWSSHSAPGACARRRNTLTARGPRRKVSGKHKSLFKFLSSVTWLL